LTLTTAESANIGIATSMQRSSVFIGNSVFAHAGCAVVAAPAFVCVVVFVMGLKLATAFKSARTFYQPLTLFFILPTQTLLKINCD
jgi:hypothetical protein